MQGVASLQAFVAASNTSRANTCCMRAFRVTMKVCMLSLQAEQPVPFMWALRGRLAAVGPQVCSAHLPAIAMRHVQHEHPLHGMTSKPPCAGLQRAGGTLSS